MKFITVMIFLPFIGASLYMIFYPRESVLFGNRWKLRDENLEPSDKAIKNNRIIGIILLIITIISLALGI